MDFCCCGPCSAVSRTGALPDLPFVDDALDRVNWPDQADSADALIVSARHAEAAALAVLAPRPPAASLREVDGQDVPPMKLTENDGDHILGSLGGNTGPAEQSQGEPSFSVAFDKASGKSLGIVLTMQCPEKLQVISTTDDPSSLVYAWNQENPQKAIGPGDRLVALNGKQLSASEMMEELRHPHQLLVTFVRDVLLVLPEPVPEVKGFTPATASDSSSDHSVLSQCSDEENLEISGPASLLRDDDATVAVDGTLADSYVLSDQLGDGAYGVVVRAKCKATNKEFAVKTMDNKHALKNLREIKIHGKLNHPKVARLHSVIREESCVHLVVELCQGGSLADRVSCFIRYRMGYSSGRKGLPMKFIKHSVRELLVGIAYLHHHHIAHRDIKADNFMYANCNETSPGKIIDFGYAVRYRRHTKLKTPLGTCHYVAPEVLQQSYDEKCDIWSSGVTAFYCFAGRYPYDGGTESKTEGLIAKGIAFEALLDMSECKTPAMTTFLEASLTRDPTARPSAKTLLAESELLQRKQSKWMPKWLQFN